MCARLSELHREMRRAASCAELAKDIARSLYEHRTQSVVVTDKPLVLLALVSKQWRRLERRLSKQRASTLDVQKRQGLTREIAWMQTRRFSTNANPEALELLKADVIFAPIEELLRFAPECQALYATCPMTKEQLHMIIAWMPKGGMVVMYETGL